MRVKKNIYHQYGFTLVELAVVVFIISIMMAAAVRVGLTVSTKLKFQETDLKMEKAIDALAAYAQRYNRLPCPSDPSFTPFGNPPLGAETGTDFSPNADGVCRVDAGGVVGTDEDLVYRHDGILPWQALGLAREDVLDSWGNYLTYHVTPMFAYNYDELVADAQPVNAVHAQCRVDAVWYDVAGNPMNGPKARFCCPNVAIPGFQDAGHVYVEDAAGELVSPFLGYSYNPGPPEFVFSYPSAGGLYADFTTTPNTAYTATDESLSTPAFVLISHGPNGTGAYLADGTRNRIAGNSGDEELKNNDGDTAGAADDARRFVSRSYSDNESVGSGSAGGIDYYDDLVKWRTQNQLYAEFGNNSCVRP